MNDFIKDTTEIPSLSFGAPEPEPELPVQQPEEKKEVMDDSVLSDEQKAMVDAFVSQIDLANTNGILQYGAGAQKKMADFSEKTLENVRSKDLPKYRPIPFDKRMGVIEAKDRIRIRVLNIRRQLRSYPIFNIIMLPWLLLPPQPF